MEENYFEKYVHEQCPIFITGEISNEVAVKLQVQIAAKLKMFEDNFTPEEDRIITVNITDSPGGSVSAGWAMYDTMRACHAKIKVISSGMVASMAVVLVLAGDKGMREAYPHTEFLLHQPLGGAQGQASDILIQARHIEKARMRLYQVISQKTGQSIERIAADCDRDFILNAEEALQYGITDRIITLEERIR